MYLPSKKVLVVGLVAFFVYVATFHFNFDYFIASKILSPSRVSGEDSGEVRRSLSLNGTDNDELLEGGDTEVPAPTLPPSSTVSPDAETDDGDLDDGDEDEDVNEESALEESIRSLEDDQEQFASPLGEQVDNVEVSDGGNLPFSPDVEPDQQNTEIQEQPFIDTAAENTPVGIPAEVEPDIAESPDVGNPESNPVVAEEASFDTPPAPNQRKNVVFLMADDMRPQLGAYFGQDHPTPSYQRPMHTPNFNRLANKSMVFQRAYVQYSLCGPSRTSMLTSRRPDATRIFGNNHYWRVTGGNFTTIPQYFKANGYTTIGIGKVFHPSVSSNDNDPISWTEDFYSIYTDMHYESQRRVPGWRAVTQEQRKAIPLTDEYAVSHALKRLEELAPTARTGEQPFFMGLGFRKPHISLICPKEFHDLYPLETDKLYLDDTLWQTPQVGFPMENITKVDGKYRIPEQFLRELRRAYFGCISYVDSLLGRVLDTLEQLQLDKNTVVSFIADHGYHLGENDHWGKYFPAEIANHVPMMISVPGVTDKGGSTRALVEALDMFPTIVSAAGLPPIPECPKSSSQIAVCTDGIDLTKLLENPDLAVRGAAISQVLHGSKVMVYSMRSDRYRYIVSAKTVHTLRPNGNYDLTFDWNVSEDAERELYDHRLDPEERFNRIEDPAYSAVVKDLQNRLQQRVSPIYDVPVKIA